MVIIHQGIGNHLANSPSGAGARAATRFASGPGPGRCSCRPGCGPPPCASGTQLRHRTGRRIQSTYTSLHTSSVNISQQSTIHQGNILLHVLCLTIAVEGAGVGLGGHVPILALVDGVVVVRTEVAILHLLLPLPPARLFCLLFLDTIQEIS